MNEVIRLMIVVLISAAVAIAWCLYERREMLERMGAQIEQIQRDDGLIQHEEQLQHKEWLEDKNKVHRQLDEVDLKLDVLVKRGN